MDADVTMQEVMTREYVGVNESDTVLDAVELMREQRAGSVIVLRGSEPVGILTEWDVLGVVADRMDPAETTVDEVMSQPVITVEATTPLVDAAARMSQADIRNLVVEDESDLAGVLTERDVIAAAASVQRTGGDWPEAGTNRTATNGEGESVQGSPAQGICEACGSLADTLREFNGRLVCVDCRGMERTEL